MAKNWKYYIEKNDFEGAFNRWVSAPKNWKTHWFETCETIFNACADWSQKFIIDPVKQTIRKIFNVSFLSSIDTTRKIFRLTEDCESSEKCYLTRFYDSKNNLIFSKVGTTKRSVEERMKECLKLKGYKNSDCSKVIIDKIYDCGDLPAEGLESHIRAEYIKKYPKTYVKNDRFFGIEFDFDFIDEIVKKYLAIA